MICAAACFASEAADAPRTTGTVAPRSENAIKKASSEDGVTQATGTVTWATSTFASYPNANALRFATLFNFWFDADSPNPISHTLTLFKPGSPAEVTFWTDNALFIDGFESEDTSQWSITVP